MVELEQDEFEFGKSLEVWFQPVVEMATGTVVYHEALIRRSCSENISLRPSVFFPAIERAGKNAQLDRHVIGMVARKLAESQEGAIGVNLTVASLADDELPDYLENELQKHGVLPSRVILEIHESVKNLDRAHGSLSRLQAAGVRIACDNIYADLTPLFSLKGWTVNILKMDGLLIKDIRNNPLHQILGRTILEIAGLWGATTVAECVEDAETLSFLKTFGVHMVQGYHVGMPQVGLQPPTAI